MGIEERRAPPTVRAASLAAGACVGAGGADGGGCLGVGGTSRAAAEGATGVFASSGVNLNHLSAKPRLVCAASQNVTYSSSVSWAFRSAGVEIDDT